MAKKSANSNYNTNLASEFLMMSLLHRVGKDAYLSLGNKKGVDIVVKTNKGAICILEVKGVNKQNDWLIGNYGNLPVAPNLIYALVSFNGKIGDLTESADFWIIPSSKLAKSGEHKVSKNEKTVYISNKYIRENYDEYKNKIRFLDDYLKTH